MRAAFITTPGPPEVLEIREAPDPVAGPDEILVRVRASGLNRADLLQRKGRYPAPRGVHAQIPGLEFAGDVIGRGERVTRWREGDRVFGIVAGGAHAELVVSHERAVAAVPTNVGWVEAGAIPEVFITAHDALVTQAGLRSGERVLIHAVGSGVGTAAVQLARAIGAVPFGSARTASKIDAVRELGLEDGVLLDDGLESLPEHVRRWTGESGFDVVLDLVGGPYVPESVHALGVGGRLMLVGLVAGRHAEMPLGELLSRRITLRGTVLRSRHIEEKILATRAFEREVVPLLASGAMRAIVDSTFPLSEIAEAHRRLESDVSVGKVVLEIGG